MPRGVKRLLAAFAWLDGFICEFDVGLANNTPVQMYAEALEHFRETPRRKRMPPAEQQWLRRFTTKYGIPPNKRISAYDALRAHVPPARRTPDPEQLYEKQRTFYCREEPAR